MNIHSGQTLLLAIVLSSACAQSLRHSDASARKDNSIITHENLVENHFQNAYDAVASLRSNWLHERGTDSFRTPSKVWVYLDLNKLGGVETLSSVAIMGVSYIQHFDGIDATTRWGIGHSAGVILVSTHPVVTSNAFR